MESVLPTGLNEMTPQSNPFTRQPAPNAYGMPNGSGAGESSYGAGQFQLPGQNQQQPYWSTPPALSPKQKMALARDLLAQSDQNLGWVAAQLGIHPTTLYRWRKQGKV